MDKKFEKYSLSEAVDQISDEIVEFALPRFEWWYLKGRFASKGKGIRRNKNFCEIFEFKPKYQNPDFQVSKLSLKLVFLVSEDDDEISSSGYCFTFDNSIGEISGPKDLKRLYPKRTTRGLEIGMEIRIFIPKNIDEYQEIDLVENARGEIYETTVHELTHLYQSYKITSKGIDYEDYRITASIEAMMNKMTSDYEANLFTNFLYLLYVCLTKSETAAYLAQARNKHGSKGNFWIEYLRWFKERSPKAMLNQFRREMTKNRISEEKFLKILNEFGYENDVDFKMISLEEFVEWAYCIINKKKNYLMKKVGKIAYQEMQDKKLIQNNP